MHQDKDGGNRGEGDIGFRVSGFGIEEVVSGGLRIVSEKFEVSDIIINNKTRAENVKPVPGI
jgi:small ligand-binding sensory domain FIST